MKGAKFFVLLAGAAGLRSLSYGFWDEHAKEMLQRCMDKTLNVNVRAIVSQRCADSSQVIQIKVERTKAGKSRMTVIAPINEQGYELVDDGTVMSTFDPDTHETELRASQRRKDTASGNLTGLAERNYVLEIGPKTNVAGRPAMVVNATAKHKEMGTRKYFIDAETAYLLRLEVRDAGGQVSTCFSTLTVSYPGDIEEPVARASAQEIQRVCARDASATTSNGKPRKLPFGFVVQEVEALNPGSRAIRVTDGLVRGMIYEWQRGPSDAAGPGADQVWTDVGNKRILVAVEAPREVREKLLLAFSGKPSPHPTTQTSIRSLSYGTATLRRHVQE